MATEAMGSQEGRTAHREQSDPLGRSVRPSPGQARNKSGLQVPSGAIQLGEKAPRLSPCASSDSRFHLGERVRLLPIAVTATSCRAGEGEVRRKQAEALWRTMVRGPGLSPGYTARRASARTPLRLPSLPQRAATSSAPLLVRRGLGRDDLAGSLTLFCNFF